MNSKGVMPVHSNIGWLLPCCYADTVHMEQFSILLEEHLKVENAESIEAILESDNWKQFYETILNDYENAPYVCKYRCTKGNVWPTKLYPDNK